MVAADTDRERNLIAEDNRKLTFKVVRNLMVIFVLLVFLGFPGTLKKVIGSGPAKLLETASFGLQFVLIALASGEDVWSIKLLNINYAFFIVYIYLIYVTADSLVVSIDRKMVLTSVIHLVLTAMFALWLIDQFKMEDLLEMFYIALILFVGIMLVGMVIFQGVTFYNYQGSKTFRGVFLTKNECGTTLSLGLSLQGVLLIMRLKKKKRIGVLFLGLMAVQFLMLLMTKNMGSLLVTFVALGYMFYYSLQKKKKRLPLCLIFIVASISFLFFALTVLQALGPFLESMGKDATLTGRTGLWERCIYVMQNNRTMTGYGYLMFWRTPSIVKVFHEGFDKDSWAATASASMHNMILECWCDQGLIGVGLLFLMLITANNGIRHLGEEQYMFSSGFIVMYTVSNLTERGMMPDSLFTLTFFLVLGMMFQAKNQAILKKRKKARVYEYREPEAVEGKDMNPDVPDWFAFQQKVTGTKSVSFSRDVLQKAENEEEEEREEEKTHFESLFSHLDKD